MWQNVVIYQHIHSAVILKKLFKIIAKNILELIRELRHAWRD
jgi:hypothetical protein